MRRSRSNLYFYFWWFCYYDKYTSIKNCLLSTTHTVSTSPSSRLLNQMSNYMIEKLIWTSFSCYNSNYDRLFGNVSPRAPLQLIYVHTGANLQKNLLYISREFEICYGFPATGSYVRWLLLLWLERCKYCPVLDDLVNCSAWAYITFYINMHSDFCSAYFLGF